MVILRGKVWRGTVWYGRRGKRHKIHILEVIQ